MLLEGTPGSKSSEGGSMKGTIAKRFEELDWDNNGKSHPALYATDMGGACMSNADRLTMCWSDQHQ